MAKSESLEDLKRIARAKHGEDWAYILACKFGNPNHKASWRKAIAEPARSPEQTLNHLGPTHFINRLLCAFR